MGNGASIQRVDQTLFQSSTTAAQPAAGAAAADGASIQQAVDQTSFQSDDAAARAAAAAAAAGKLDETQTKKLWFDLIDANKTKSDVSAALKQFIETHKKDFESEDRAQNPLFWQEDDQGNNALHLLLRENPANGATNSVLFKLLTINSEYTHEGDALLQKNSEGKTALEIGIASKIRRTQIAMVEEVIGGGSYLAEKRSRNLKNINFLSNVCTKLDEDGNSVLHHFARHGSDVAQETLLNLQEQVCSEAKKIKGTVKERSTVNLQDPLQTENNNGETPLEVALKSGNQTMAMLLITGKHILQPATIKGNAVEIARVFTKPIEAVKDATVRDFAPTRIIDLNAANKNGKRPIDLFSSETFPTLTIENFAKYILKTKKIKTKAESTPLPETYDRDIQHAQDCAMTLIKRTKNDFSSKIKEISEVELTPNEKLQTNPINELLKIGLFKAALICIQKCDPSLIKYEDKDGKDVESAFKESKEAFLQALKNNDEKENNFKSPLMDNIEKAIKKKLKEKTKSGSASDEESLVDDQEEGVVVFDSHNNNDNSFAAANPAKQTKVKFATSVKQKQSSTVCAIQ